MHYCLVNCLPQQFAQDLFVIMSVLKPATEFNSFIVEERPGEQVITIRGMYLSFNQLSGVIPEEIGKNCGKLEHLDLSGNSLVQGIPRSLGNCGLLRTFLLYSNLLEEVIPIEFGNLKSLEVLAVLRNTLSGSILGELGNCKELSIVVLSNLFDRIGDVEFDSLNDELNYFEGEMPEEVVSLPKLRILWAPMVNLERSFPSNWGACVNLGMVNFSSEFLHRGIPKPAWFLQDAAFA